MLLLGFGMIYCSALEFDWSLEQSVCSVWRKEDKAVREEEQYYMMKGRSERKEMIAR